ncbi:unnamed protein product [Hymenolepis diminuta]|uniref:Uncharacterized protein n=1 Tax=Hymenolepis diminuta TaxID=6216 RepID=A0A564YI28_HYMDI|nr:unnamed protein product [Hymenolepis diminuta]
MSLLLVLLHLGISAALSLNQAYGNMKGDIIESCNYGRFYVDSSPNSVEIMEELECEAGSILDQHASPSNVEVMQDCCCDCDFSVTYYCRLCAECCCAAPTIAEILVRTMPDIPIDLADALIFMQPNIVRHIIESHYDLASLVICAHSDTLAYIITSTPDFSKYLSGMSPYAIYTILHKIPFPCEYLQSIERISAETIAHKVPMFDECLPEISMTTTAPTETEITSVSPIDIDSLFEEEELEQMTAKLPNIKKYLGKVDPDALISLLNSYPDFMTFFNNLDQNFIEFLNMLNPDELVSTDLHGIFLEIAGDDTAIQTFGNLFA